MESFLSIKQAVEFSGKSKSTIRRMIDEIVKDATSEARSKILPSAEDVERFRRRKEQYSWKISEDLLRERFAIEESEEGSEAASADKGSDATLNVQIVELLRDDIATLKEQLDRKDGQLSEANQRLKEANERNREQNILLHDLQDRIPQLKSGRDGEVVDADGTAEKGSEPKKKRRKLFGII